MKIRALLAVSFVFLLCFTSISSAADYPAKPITLLTAFNPGGGSDVSHRTIEKFAKEYIPQPIVVTYKAGAGGEMGWTELAQGKPDGYFIGGVDIPHIILQPMLRPKGQPGYKTEELNPLCGLVYDPDIIMVREDSKWKTLKEFLDYAKANPKKVTVATVGKLTGDHLFLMQVENLTGAEFTQVPYPGGGKAIPALLSGEVDSYFGSANSFLRMEKTRGLAIATDKRFELCSGIPTFKEQGYALLSAKYRGLATPLKFPKEAQAFLEAQLSKMAANPEYQKAVKNVGLMPYYQTSKEFADTIAKEKARIRPLLVKMGELKE